MLSHLSARTGAVFQSLIWVACPTGCRGFKTFEFDPEVSIPHMGCMPYGHVPYGDYAIWGSVSIPHMGCMPYGLNNRIASVWCTRCFNPSYGLHALRASDTHGVAGRAEDLFQSLIWVACPTGRIVTSMSRSAILSFQSLIWVACPTGGDCPPSCLRRSDVSIPHMGCMPYGLFSNRTEAPL